MSYYVYLNWQVQEVRATIQATIHVGNCGFCNNGKGCHEHPLDNKNGQWGGPYETIRDAKVAAGKVAEEKEMNIIFKEHDCVWGLET